MVTWPNGAALRRRRPDQIDDAPLSVFNGGLTGGDAVGAACGSKKLPFAASGARMAKRRRWLETAPKAIDGRPTGP